MEEGPDKFGFYNWEASSTGKFSTSELENIRDEHAEVMAEALTNDPVQHQFDVIVELLDHGSAQKAGMVVKNLIRINPKSREKLNDLFIEDDSEDAFYNLINTSPHRIPRRRSAHRVFKKME